MSAVEAGRGAVTAPLSRRCRDEPARKQIYHASVLRRLLIPLAILRTEEADYSLNALDVLWAKDDVPNLPVVTQDGQVFKFYDDLIATDRRHRLQ